MPLEPDRPSSLSSPSRQSAAYSRSIHTIDAHAEGGPLRLIVSGFPSPEGRTMLEKRDWLLRHADHLRRAVLLEPRGHADMCGAILTEPVTPTAHAGVLFLHNSGVATMSGHGVIAVTRIALEHRLIEPGGDGRTLVLDTPAGVVVSRAGGAGQAGRAGEATVSFVNVPSFVLHAGLSVSAGGRAVRVDVAFGGAFYAIVDSESVGLPIDVAHVPELRRMGIAIARAVEAARTISHPLEPGLSGLAGTVFTSPARAERAALRNVTVFADAQVDRSPGGTATAAVMAVVDAMGLLGDESPFVHEGLLDTHIEGRVRSRTMVGELPAIVPELRGTAWITGTHAFVIDEDDPLAWGVRV